ncbi:hypothetical protein [Thermodesulfovibrio hydrogeniphilus]
MAILGEAVSNKALLKNKVEIASHPSDARKDSKKYLIFKWLYQLLDFYLYLLGSARLIMTSFFSHCQGFSLLTRNKQGNVVSHLGAPS